MQLGFQETKIAQKNYNFFPIKKFKKLSRTLDLLIRTLKDLILIQELWWWLKSKGKIILDFFGFFNRWNANKNTKSESRRHKNDNMDGQQTIINSRT